MYFQQYKITVKPFTEVNILCKFFNKVDKYQMINITAYIIRYIVI